MPEPRNKRGKLALALVFLGASGWLAYGSFARGTSLAPAGNAAPAHAVDPGVPQTVAAVAKGVDLIGRHGWFSGDHVLPNPFGVTPPAPAPAPPEVLRPEEVAESQPAEPPKAAEPEPPELKVTLLMVTPTSARAVVDGRVVVVGDRIGEAEVTAIDAGGIAVRVGTKTHRYRLTRVDADAGKRRAAGRRDEGRKER